MRNISTKRFAGKIHWTLNEFHRNENLWKKLKRKKAISDGEKEETHTQREWKPSARPPKKTDWQGEKWKLFGGLNITCFVTKLRNIFWTDNQERRWENDREKKKNQLNCVIDWSMKMSSNCWKIKYQKRFVSTFYIILLQRFRSVISRQIKIRERKKQTELR